MCIITPTFTVYVISINPVLSSCRIPPPTIANDEVLGGKQSERLTAGCIIAFIMQHKDRFNRFSTEDSAAF